MNKKKTRFSICGKVPKGIVEALNVLKADAKGSYKKAAMPFIEMAIMEYERAPELLRSAVVGMEEAFKGSPGLYGVTHIDLYGDGSGKDWGDRAQALAETMSRQGAGDRGEAKKKLCRVLLCAIATGATKKPVVALVRDGVKAAPAPAKAPDRLPDEVYMRRRRFLQVADDVKTIADVNLLVALASDVLVRLGKIREPLLPFRSDGSAIQKGIDCD